MDFSLRKALEEMTQDRNAQVEDAAFQEASRAQTIPGTGVMLTQTPEAANFQPDFKGNAVLEGKSVDQVSPDGGVQLTPQAQAAAAQKQPPATPPQVTPGTGTGFRPPDEQPAPPAPAGAQGPPQGALPPANPNAQRPVSQEELARRRLGIPEDVSADYRIDLALNDQARKADIERLGAEREGVNAHSQALNNAAEAQRQRIAAQRQAAVDKAVADHRARLDELEKLSVNEPDRFWNEHWAGPVFSRVGASIAIGLATFGGQGQLAYKMISDGINRDIDAQKSQWEAKKMLAEKYGRLDDQLIKSYDSKLEDLERVRSTGLNAAAQRLKDMAAAMGDKEQARKAEEAVWKLQDEATRKAADTEAKVAQSVQKELDRRSREAATTKALYEKAIQKGLLKGMEKNAEAGVTGVPVGAGKKGPGGGDEVTVRAGEARIAKAAKESRPTWEAMDRFVQIAPEYGKKNRGLLEKGAAAMATNPLTHPILGAGLNVAMSDETREMTDLAKQIQAYGASETGGKAVTEAERKLSLPKGAMDQAIRDILAGDISPKTLLIVKSVSQRMKVDAAAQGNPEAQRRYKQDQDYAEQNAEGIFSR